MRKLVLRDFAIVGSLNIHPVSGAGVEVPSQAQSRIWRGVAMAGASTFAFGNDGKLHAQGLQNRIDRFEAWVCACAQGFVEALAAEACVFGDLGHAPGFGHVAERGDEYLGVGIFGGRRKIFRNNCIVIEIRCRIEPFVGYFLSLICYCYCYRYCSPCCFELLSSRAILFAFAISLPCEAFVPAASKTYSRSGARVIDAPT